MEFDNFERIEFKSWEAVRYEKERRKNHWLNQAIREMAKSSF